MQYILDNYPLYLFSLIVLLIIWKIPDEQLLALLKEIVTKLGKGEMISYPLLLLCIVCWRFHYKFLKNNFRQEYERIGKEKSYLQEKLAGIKLKGSGD